MADIHDETKKLGRRLGVEEDGGDIGQFINFCLL